MKKYKYSRKNIVKMLNQYVFDSYTVATREDFEKILLAKESKEEQSQKIMMEQVPKDRELYSEGMLTKNIIKDMNNKNIKLNNKLNKEWNNFNISKISYYNDRLKLARKDGLVQVEKDTLRELNKLLSPPIEDTNKTSLEVPEKMIVPRNKPIDCDYCELSDIMTREKINSILDYLTLISLDKKI